MRLLLIKMQARHQSTNKANKLNQQKILSLRMIKSMTGYGIAVSDSGSTKYTVEIKSLNSKFLELSLRMPKAFSEKEFQLRTDCNKQIERGKVNLSINIEQADNQTKAAG